MGTNGTGSRGVTAHRSPTEDVLVAHNDSSDNQVRQRFLEEFLGRPPAGPVEKPQVIKETETGRQTLKETKTPDRIAADYRQKAEQLLSESHKSLSYTTDQFEPRVVPFREQVRVPVEATAIDLAREALGAKASKDQLELYAQLILSLNGKTGKPDEVKFSAGSQITMPGQRADGAIVYRRNGVTHAAWYDGSSMRVNERGQGQASLKDADGTEIGFTWNPDNEEDTTEVRTKGDHRLEMTSSGTIIEKEKVAGEWALVKLTTTDDKGRELVAEFKPGEKSPNKITITDKDNNVTSLVGDSKGKFTGEKKNAKGEVIESDVQAALTRRGLVIFAQKTNPDGSSSRTYESGVVENYDKDGALTKRSGKDEWGRQVQENYKDGEALPETITVTAEGEKPIVFERKPFGQYEAEYRNDKGELVGTIELKRNGLILFVNEKEQMARAILPDGTTIARQSLANGRTEITETKDGNVLKRTLDRQGTVIDAEYTSKDGRTLKRTIAPDGQTIQNVTLTDKDGFKTELKYDRDLGIFTGSRVNKEGQVVEKAFYYQGKIVYMDTKSGESRSERLNFLERDLFGLKISEGKYDAQTGRVISRNADGSLTVESFAPGRTDIVREGTTRGTTVIGERSQISPNGEAVVHNPDETGVRLNPNGTVDRWGPEEKDNATGEPLTRAEGAYLRWHPDVDRRDFVEIHRQLSSQPEKLEKFYDALKKIDTAPNLSTAERRALRTTLMHHVAYPAELYQGNSWACNVAVIGRDLAMNAPDRYVDTIVQALSEGQITLPDGKKIPVDKCNLRTLDSTGRDMVTRVFHTVAIQSLYHPRYTFTNTEDGVGRLVPNDPATKPQAFVGLAMPDLVKIRHTLTGEQRAIVNITSVDDLVAAFEANGGRAMITAVNADLPPFSGDNLAAMLGGPTESHPNHVVSITRIDKGPPVKIYVMNQWGLQQDHSSPETAVEADVLVNSIVGRVKGRRGELVQTPGQVISAGTPGKTYFFKDGKLVEEKRK